MKTGLIVYVVGTEPVDWDANSEMRAIKLSSRADLIEIITVKSGHFDILDAWWSLLTRGMKRIVCIIGEFTPSGNLTLKGRKLCLCG
ncbi:MAG: hypothetical protein OEM06_02875 [Desulfobacteraceae bacterium]|jgi:hypothetical protein|nr:hypothetical protein [Desulfobacteraceae bacterium]MDH3572102.1 hypothetical protein [Desulfobacteraceae bacterium]MDH3720803.1 hypothetical protein [Desulfobacteraceae bacterium]MDH3835169.1 hypothetical protein [Desulfobacteraceae bacterium]MDH3872539.1 hypothetical protein [Desulfobacteraceae bacterium]